MAHQEAPVLRRYVAALKFRTVDFDGGPMREGLREWLHTRAVERLQMLGTSS